MGKNKNKNKDNEPIISGDITEDMIKSFGRYDIFELELSSKLYFALTECGIEKLADLLKMTKGDLKKIPNLDKSGRTEIKRTLKMIQEYYLSKPEPPDYRAQLDELIGLEGVKSKVKRIVAYAEMKQRMEKAGQKNASICLNMEFIGNPGTAKTTVARILAGILYQIGVLENDRIIEVGRADIVAEYEGQTAAKIKRLFQRARGHLLFIDEAYSLVEGFACAYGDEAISTIVQEMENNRDHVAVVFAGYPDNMRQLFSINPGLRSRVPFSIEFRDYSPEEMFQITELEAKKKGFSIDPTAQNTVESICKMSHQYEVAGNGRFCRNLVEDAILEYAFRTQDNIDEAKLVLLPQDFCAPKILTDYRKQSPIGFARQTVSQ